jgi:replicative DNA helicase
MIESKELERHVLAGLIKHPSIYGEIAPFLNEDDFSTNSSQVHATLFKILKNCISKGEEDLDEVVLAQKVKDFNISFEDNIDTGQYIASLGLRKISKTGTVNAARELKKVSVRRAIRDAAVQVANKMKSMGSNHTFEEIIEHADSIYNKQIDLYHVNDGPQNIYESMEGFIEERGDNPRTEFGFMGPFDRINELYGSLLRPGNISVVVARSGVGKTTFCLDFVTKVSEKYENVPVLHFDNGEMSQEELTMRQCAALTKVPIHYLETGLWRNNADFVRRIRAAWKTIKNFKFYYYNVAGLPVEEMVNVIRRFYYSNVGRGNNLIFSFDYIKTTDQTSNRNESEWQTVGNMVTKFKNLIQKEILGDDGPVISMITSVQSNRYGITTNRRAENTVDDESVVSLSDRIIQYCSHMFHLRKKTLDQIQEEPDGFGTHQLSCLKSRHLGENFHRAINPVQMPDNSKRNNYINLHMDNFSIEECGDLQDMVDALNLGNVRPMQTSLDNIPDEL